MTFDYQNRDTGKVIERCFSIHDDIPVIVFEDSQPFHRIYSKPMIHFHGEWSTTANQDSITKWQRENLRKD